MSTGGVPEKFIIGLGGLDHPQLPYNIMVLPNTDKDPIPTDTGMAFVTKEDYEVGV